MQLSQQHTQPWLRSSGTNIFATIGICLLTWIFCACGFSEEKTAVVKDDTDGIENLENGEAILSLIQQGKTFSRIISLYGAHTENLVFMGAKNKLVGVSRGDDKALGLPVFDPKSGAENFLAARPDLVLMRPMHERAYKGLVSQLEQSGVTVLALQPCSPQQMFSYWLALGALSGQRTQAENMINEFKAKLTALQNGRIPQDMAKRKRVYFESMHDKVKTFSPDSIAIYVLESAGGVNIATDAASVQGSNIAAYNKERVFLHADEIDFFLAQQGKMNDITEDQIRKDFALLPAIKEGRILILDEEKVSRPTPRLLESISLLLDRFYGQLGNTKKMVKGEAK